MRFGFYSDDNRQTDRQTDRETAKKRNWQQVDVRPRTLVPDCQELYAPTYHASYQPYKQYTINQSINK